MSGSIEGGSKILQTRLIHKREYPLNESVLGFAVIELPNGDKVDIRYTRPLIAKQGDYVRVERRASLTNGLRWGIREKINYEFDASEFETEQ